MIEGDLPLAIFEPRDKINREGYQREIKERKRGKRMEKFVMIISENKNG